jgi:hypothetical protein
MQGIGCEVHSRYTKAFCYRKIATALIDEGSPNCHLLRLEGDEAEDHYALEVTRTNIIPAVFSICPQLGAVGAKGPRAWHMVRQKNLGPRSLQFSH